MNTPKEDSYEEYAYKAYIKDIYLELPEYHFQHRSIGEDEDDNFIGREKIKDQFLETLQKGGEKGAYLVTGYRGMGKTSFVKKVLSEYKTKENQIKVINISFAQSKLEDIDVLKLIVKTLLDFTKEKNYIIKRYLTLSLNRSLKYLIPFFFLFFFFGAPELKSILGFIISFFKQFKTLEVGMFFDWCNIHLSDKTITYSNNSSGNTLGKIWEPIVLAIAVSLLFSLFLQFIFTFIEFVLSGILAIPDFIAYLWKNRSNQKLLWQQLKNWLNINRSALVAIRERGKLIRIYEKLNNLNERCTSTVTNEDSVSTATINLPFGFLRRNTKVHPIANAKSIEQELIEILNEFSQLKNNYNRRKFVFVFDELDKVEPNASRGLYYESDIEKGDIARSRQYDIRERKQMVLNILASLKYFITEAKSRFIFIAGREMFDASLADISDRQSSISSIFHKIIYVDSFLKDKVSNGGVDKVSHLTNMFDNFLDKVLVNTNDSFSKRLTTSRQKRNFEQLIQNKSKTDVFLKKYYNILTQVMGKEKEEAQKIIFILQNFIIYLVYRSNGSPKKMVKILESQLVYKIPEAQYPKNIILSFDDKPKTRTYLHFAYNNQYKLGFITYLYRPFILTYSQFFKKYSDSMLVATPYLMDHLIKFHPFAFSLQNLELLPEVLSTNKHPEMRFFIEDLVNFLSQNHLRETEIGLFEYKFYNKTYHEITYLSKIFEEEAAAFNFTLDEGYHIKLQLKAKIKELRSIYKDYKETNAYIHSIAFLHTLLGDSHFFDQEFDDAVVSYSDAIQSMRTIQSEKLSFKQLLMILKCRLKLGLTYEKMKAYETATGYYNDAIRSAWVFITNYLPKDNKAAPSPPSWQHHEVYLHGYGDAKFLTDDTNATVDYKFRHSVNDTGEIVSFSILKQIVNQAYIANLFLNEKFSIEGVTTNKLNIVVNSYNLFSKKIKGIEINKRIMSNYYTNLGGLAYYKNMITNSTPFNSTAAFVPSSAPTQSANAADANVQESTLLVDDKQKLPQPFDELAIIYEFVYKFVENVTANRRKQENRDFRFSNLALTYYLKALFVLVNEDEPDEFIIKDDASIAIAFNKIKDVIIHKDFRNQYDKTILKNKANILSKIGDCLFQLIDIGAVVDIKGIFPIDELVIVPKDSGGYKDISSDDEKSPFIFDYQESTGFINLLDTKWLNNFTVTETTLNTLKTVLQIYYLAGRYYLKAGRNISFSFQFRKILKIFTLINLKNSIIDPTGKSNLDKLDFLLEKGFFQKILEVISWNSNSSDRPQVYKYKNYFDINTIAHPIGQAKHIYTNISDSPEVVEAISLIAIFKIRNREMTHITSLKDALRIPEQSIATSTSGIFTKMTRVLQLEIQVLLNKQILDNYINDKLTSFMKIPKDKKSFTSFNKYYINNICYQTTTDIHYYKNKYQGTLNYVKLWEHVYFKVYKKYRNEDPNAIYNDEFGESTEKINDYFNLFRNSFLEPNGEANFLDFINEYSALCRNSVFCLQQIIRSLNIFGVNYMISNSYVASFHRKLGAWLKHLEFCSSIAEYMYQTPTLPLIEKKWENLKVNAFTSYVLEKKIDENSANQLKLNWAPHLNALDSFIKTITSILDFHSSAPTLDTIEFEELCKKTIYKSKFTPLDASLRDLLENTTKELIPILNHEIIEAILRTEAPLNKILSELTDPTVPFTLEVKEKVENLISLTYKKLERLDILVKNLFNSSDNEILKPLTSKLAQSENLINEIVRISACHKIVEKKKQQGSNKNENGWWKLKTKIDEELRSFLQSEITDTTSQYQMALQYYHKSLQMHSAGKAYKQEMTNMLYLEDDFNDNLYHFSISIERQMINSGIIRRHIKNLDSFIHTSPLYKYESYINDKELRG